jgi:hypothetical protein
MENYEIIKNLGNGPFCHVSQVKKKSTGQFFPLKNLIEAMNYFKKSANLGNVYGMEN